MTLPKLPACPWRTGTGCHDHTHDGYVARCACGWQSRPQSSTSKAAHQHDGHLLATGESWHQHRHEVYHWGQS